MAQNHGLPGIYIYNIYIYMSCGPKSRTAWYVHKCEISIGHLLTLQMKANISTKSKMCSIYNYIKQNLNFVAFNKVIVTLIVFCILFLESST